MDVATLLTEVWVVERHPSHAEDPHLVHVFSNKPAADLWVALQDGYHIDTRYDVSKWPVWTNATGPATHTPE